MKRHEVMDLFHGHMIEEVDGPWISVEKSLPDCKHTKVKAKLNNGDEVYAYFYADKAIKFNIFGIIPCHFWHCMSRDQLFNVTDWKYLKENTETKEKSC
jgi:hypothetical protein